MALPNQIPEFRESRFSGPFGISVAMHLLLIPILSGLFHSKNSDTNASPAIPRLMRVKLPKAEVKDNLEVNGQVIDMTSLLNESEKAPDTRFLSDRNRVVSQETQARATGAPSKNPSEGGGKQIGKKAEPKKGKGLDLSVPSKFLGENIGTNQGPREASLPPSNYLPEISFGDDTILNTREYVYSTFFVRMKRQMEAVWNPLRWIDRSRISKEEYITAVRIILRPDGYLEEVKLLEPSGNAALDQEALAAVQHGAPYLNPPKELIGPDGHVQIGPWRFIVSLGSQF